MIAKVNSETMNNRKSYLVNKFSATDLKGIIFFLLIFFFYLKVVNSNKKITLDQSAYIKTALEKFNMHDSRAVSISLLLVHILLLTYITICTPLDLSTAVNI